MFALTDRIASGAYVALREAGLAIPDDVAVVGFDDIEAPRLEPPLSSVRQQPRQMGAAAARLLFERIRFGTQAPSRTIVLPPQLIVRASSDPAQIAPPLERFARQPTFSPPSDPAFSVPELNAVAT